MSKVLPWGSGRGFEPVAWAKMTKVICPWPVLTHRALVPLLQAAPFLSAFSAPLVLPRQILRLELPHTKKPKAAARKSNRDWSTGTPSRRNKRGCRVMVDIDKAYPDISILPCSRMLIVLWVILSRITEMHPRQTS